MENIPTKITGSHLSASEWNNVPDELENAIVSVGITLSGADRKQLAKAIATYAAAGDFYTDGGSVNNHTLTHIGNFEHPIQYHEGMTVRFLSANTNTGPATANVETIGSIAIKKDQAGTALSGGEIVQTAIIELTYRTTPSTFFEITSVKLATEVHPGIIQIATKAEMETPVSNARALTPENAIWHPGVAKAWIVYNTGGGSLTIHKSYNISSAVRSGTGVVDINTSVTFASSISYGILATTTETHVVSEDTRASRTSNFIRVRRFRSSQDTDVDGTSSDIVTVAFFGELT